MEIVSLRDKTRGDATASYISVNGVYQTNGLEDIVREPPTGRPEEWYALVAWVKSWKVFARTAIPMGRYRLMIDWSDHFQRLMVRLLNVPGFDGVRMHPGLKPEDTEGCILVGDEQYETDAGPRVRSGTTRPAADRLQAMIQATLDRGEEVWWEFKENPEA